MSGRRGFRILEISVSLFIATLWILEPSALSAPASCAKWLEGRKNLSFNLKLWRWDSQPIQLAEEASVNFRDAVVTKDGVAWIRQTGRDPHSLNDSTFHPATLFLDATLRNGVPTTIGARETWNTSSLSSAVSSKSIPFRWIHLRAGVVPSKETPAGEAIERRKRSVWNYWAGRVDFYQEENVLHLRHFALGPPIDAQLTGAPNGDKHDFRPIQDLRLIQTDQGVVATYFNPYALMGLFQFATFAAPVMRDLRKAEAESGHFEAAATALGNLETLLTAAHQSWEKIRLQVAGFSVIDKFHVYKRLEPGKPFLTQMTYGPSRVIRRDHFLTSVERDGKLGGSIYSFEVREMVMAVDEKSSSLLSETRDTAVLYGSDHDGQTTVHRVETRTKNPGPRRYGFPEYPNPQECVSAYYGFDASLAQPAVAPFPRIQSPTAGLDYWFRHSVILQVIKSAGRNAIPTLEFMGP